MNRFDSAFSSSQRSNPSWVRFVLMAFLLTIGTLSYVSAQSINRASPAGNVNQACEGQQVTYNTENLGVGGGVSYTWTVVGGFFVTGNTYMGQHGLSLRLKGQEPGINDKAEQRGIVMHAADYVGEHVAQQQGFIGRSWGCPAVPTELNEPIIETIKEGSAFFIYHPGSQYQKYSRYARVK